MAGTHYIDYIATGIENNNNNNNNIYNNYHNNNTSNHNRNNSYNTVVRCAFSFVRQSFFPHYLSCLAKRNSNF